MTAGEVLRRLQQFLLLLAALLFGGTLLELWLVNHTKDAVQWLPFGLCFLGMLTTFAVLWRKSNATVRALRWCMALVILGSIFGIFEHIYNNLEFAREIHPNASTRELLMKSLGGANPLLAPGMLAVAGLLALAATYGYQQVETTETRDRYANLQPSGREL
jgi:hypothetical protein